MVPLGISANNNKDLAFIIGSRKPLPIGPLKGKMHGDRRMAENQIYGYDEVVREDFLAENGLYFEGSTGKIIEGGTLYAGEKGKGTSLDTDQFELMFPSVLVWNGDLDGDRKDDYIIIYGEKVAQICLYLSSEAEGDDLVKLVAMFLVGSCC